MDGGQRTIAVIGGTGAEGGGIALRLANSGRRIIIGSRDAAKAADAAASLNAILGSDAIAGLGNNAAVAAAEIVILTVPYAAQVATVESIRAELAGKILVDATAPLVPPRVSRLGDQVRVVSALQNVSAVKLRRLGEDVGCDVLVSADDAAARQEIIELLTGIGLRGIDAGPLCNSAAAEALTSVLIWINRKYKVPGAGIRITGLED